MDGGFALTHIHDLSLTRRFADTSGEVTEFGGEGSADGVEEMIRFNGTPVVDGV